jgi:hypothetical protein
VAPFEVLLGLGVKGLGFRVSGLGFTAVRGPCGPFEVLLYMCPRTAIYVVCILLYMCPRTAV